MPPHAVGRFANGGALCSAKHTGLYGRKGRAGLCEKTRAPAGCAVVC